MSRDYEDFVEWLLARRKTMAEPMGVVIHRARQWVAAHVRSYDKDKCYAYINTL